MCKDKKKDNVIVYINNTEVLDKILEKLDTFSNEDKISIKDKIVKKLLNNYFGDINNYDNLKNVKEIIIKNAQEEIVKSFKEVDLDFISMWANGEVYVSWNNKSNITKWINKNKASIVELIENIIKDSVNKVYEERKEYFNSWIKMQCKEEFNKLFKELKEKNIYIELKSFFSKLIQEEFKNFLTIKFEMRNESNG